MYNDHVGGKCKECEDYSHSARDPSDFPFRFDGTDYTSFGPKEIAGTHCEIDSEFTIE